MVIDGYNATLTKNANNSRSLNVTNAFGTVLVGNVPILSEQQLLKFWNRQFRAGVAKQLKQLWEST